MNLFFLPFVTAVAANSFLNLGFGVRRLISYREYGFPRVFAPALAIGIVGIMVWPLFALVLAPLSLGYLEAILLVPISVLISTASDRLVRAFSFGGKEKRAYSDPSAVSAYDGLTYAAAFLILRLSSGFLDSVLFASGSAVGYLLCAIFLRAIRERSDTEPVPRFLRGIPLMLVAAGLMAILASFLASASFAAFGKRI